MHRILMIGLLLFTVLFTLGCQKRIVVHTMTVPEYHFGAIGINATGCEPQAIEVVIMSSEEGYLIILCQKKGSSTTALRVPLVLLKAPVK